MHIYVYLYLNMLIYFCISVYLWFVGVLTGIMDSSVSCQTYDSSHVSHLSHTSHELQSRLSGSWECVVSDIRLKSCLTSVAHLSRTAVTIEWIMGVPAGIKDSSVSFLTSDCVVTHIHLTFRTNCSHDWASRGDADGHRLNCIVSHARLSRVSYLSHTSHELQSRLSESWGCWLAWSTQMCRVSHMTESWLTSVSHFARTAVTIERIMGVLTGIMDSSLSSMLVKQYVLTALIKLFARYPQVLQHTATSCNTLQHTAYTRRGSMQYVLTALILYACYPQVLQHTATSCNALQHTAYTLRGSMQYVLTFLIKLYARYPQVLQQTATHCNALQCTATPWNAPNTLHTHYGAAQHVFTIVCALPQRAATHDNTLQHTAPRCNMLHYTATTCKTQQHTAYTLRGCMQCVLTALIKLFADYSKVLQYTATCCNALH